MKRKTKPIKPMNSADRGMREGEHGWKSTSQTHKAKKKYSRKTKTHLKDLL